MNWKQLGFAYTKTNKIVSSNYLDGEWSTLNLVEEDSLNIHVASTCINYGQAAFEGLKAYRGPDNKVRLFRWEENWKRLNKSADALLMPSIEKDDFKAALVKLINANLEFVPPYESGATLYIRPIILGTGPGLGLAASSEYIFTMFCSPVGPYFKDGFKPVDFVIWRGFDRAAPKGTGNLKIAGNYAGTLKSIKEAQTKGFANVIYLDACEKKYIDECGPANFFAIKGDVYITPKSASILPSITNDSIIQIAKSIGLKVEQRKVEIEELETFSEAGACGTAAIITSIGKIVDQENKKEYVFSKNGQPGEVSSKLYNTLRGIQSGIIKDGFGWVSEVRKLGILKKH